MRRARAPPPRAAAMPRCGIHAPPPPPPPPPPAVTVRELPGRGRCLLASRDIDKGETILTEAPLVVARMPDCGASGRLACERCLAFLGPSDLHASVHAAHTPLSDAESWCVTDQRIVPCGCGALYCCRRCADADTACGHSLLCEDGGGGEASTALRAWRKHTAEAELPELDLVRVRVRVRVRVSTYPNPHPHPHRHPHPSPNQGGEVACGKAVLAGQAAGRPGGCGRGRLEARGRGSLRCSQPAAGKTPALTLSRSLSPRLGLGYRPQSSP